MHQNIFEWLVAECDASEISLRVVLHNRAVGLIRIEYGKIIRIAKSLNKGSTTL